MSSPTTLSPVPRTEREERLLPARMLNEFAYCPRLFHLEWVQGEWRESAETLDGARVHQRVDAPSKGGIAQPAPELEQHARSVELSDPELRLIAKIDVVEADGREATPIDYKRSKRPDVPEGAYEPERVQVCAQGLLLRAHGFESRRGFLYFAGSRQRVEVPFTEALIARTLALRNAALRAAASARAPEPLRKDLEAPFSFDTRNRRPPKDPVNALLSFAYSLLTSEWTATLSAIGFDPYVGFLHQIRYGRPALSLDLMEEFRPLIADSVVVNAINTGVVTRLLGRHLTGEIDSYPELVTR